MSGPLFSAICLLLQIFLSKTQQQRCRKFHGSLWQISSIFFQAKKMAFVLPSHLQLQILVQSYLSVTFSGSQHCTANLKAALLLAWLVTAELRHSQFSMHLILRKTSFRLLLLHISEIFLSWALYVLVCHLPSAQNCNNMVKFTFLHSTFLEWQMIEMLCSRI